jgi:hypothetical protein
MFKIWIEDLRFIIGLFFAIVSIFLFIEGLISPAVETSEFNLNLIAGGYIGCFSVIMLGLGIWSRRETE